MHQLLGFSLQIKGGFCWIAMLSVVLARTVTMEVMQN